MMVPIYDATGVRYCAGASDFNLRNVFAALRSIKVVDRKDLHVCVNVAVHDNLRANNVIELDREGKMTWCGFTIDIDPQSDTTSPIVDSLITSPCGKQVILRTREY